MGVGVSVCGWIYVLVCVWLGVGGGGLLCVGISLFKDNCCDCGLMVLILRFVWIMMVLLNSG